MAESGMPAATGAACRSCRSGMPKLPGLHAGTAGAARRNCRNCMPESGTSARPAQYALGQEDQHRHEGHGREGLVLEQARRFLAALLEMRPVRGVPQGDDDAVHGREIVLGGRRRDVDLAAQHCDGYGRESLLLEQARRLLAALLEARLVRGVRLEEQQEPHLLPLGRRGDRQEERHRRGQAARTPAGRPQPARRCQRGAAQQGGSTPPQLRTEPWALAWLRWRLREPRRRASPGLPRRSRRQPRRQRLPNEPLLLGSCPPRCWPRGRWRPCRLRGARP